MSVEGTGVAPAAASTVTQAAPIEVSNGDTAPITFDELNEIDERAKIAKREGKDQIKAVAKETVKELQKTESKAKEKKGEPEKGEDPKNSKAEKAGEKENEDLDAEDIPVQKKTLKAKDGDAELDISEDIKIPAKVNGKMTDVPLKELLANYSGKVEWDKRFTQMDRERKEFNSKTEQASGKIKNIFGEKDPEMRLVRMAEFAGVDPLEFREKYLNDNIKILENWYSMSDAEKEMDRAQFENKLLRSKSESLEKEVTFKQSLSELDTKVQKLRKTHDIPEQEFLSRYDELDALVKQGKFKGDITPEFIAETIQKDRLWDAANDKIASLNLKLPQENRAKIVLDLVETAFSQGLNAADMQDVVQELWGSKSRESRVQAKVEEREEFLSGKKPVRKASAPREVLMFDDL